MWLLWCIVLAGRRPAQISCLTSFFRRMLRIWTRLLTIGPGLSWSWASNRKTGQAIEETCEIQPAACWWHGPCDLNSISTIWLYNSAFFNVPHENIDLTSRFSCENVEASTYSHGPIELACQADDVCKANPTQMNQELLNICLPCTYSNISKLFIVTVWKNMAFLWFVWPVK